jgi:pimeloyl-ACP methyl ester carboxylesterase
VDIVLVHGNFHGAWCWDLLVPELEQRGHRVVTVDLPVSDPLAGASEYADVAAAAIDPNSKPILIGHSMAGLVIPLVPARRAVSRLVFLAGMLPRPGISANDQRAGEPLDTLVAPTTAEWSDLGDDVWMVGPNTATEVFFHDAPPDVAAWAAGRLRPQCYRVLKEPTPLVEWPSVESDYIVCRDDRALNPEWARTAARERLGVEPVEIDGSHSPFLTRPAELASLIDSLISRPG